MNMKENTERWITWSKLIHVVTVHTLPFIMCYFEHQDG